MIESSARSFLFAQPLSMAPFNEALILLWIAILAHGAYSFLTVVQATAAGSDKVDWPGDPWTERLGAFGYLAALTAAWLGPVFFLAWGRVLDLSISTVVALVAAYLWLVFPVTLLSSLSAPSRLMLLRPRLVWRLLRQAPTLLGFYLTSGLVLFLTLSVFGLAILVGRLDTPDIPGTDVQSLLLDLTLYASLILLLPVAAVVASIGLLLYARLVGRLGLVLNRSWNGATAEGPPEVALPLIRSTDQQLPEDQPTRFLLPTPAVVGETNMYALLTEEQRPEQQPAQATLTASDVYSALPADSGSRQKAALIARQITPSRVDLRLARARRVAPVPQWPLVQGVYSFPFYRSNWRQLWLLSLGNLVVAVILYLVVRWLPF